MFKSKLSKVIVSLLRRVLGVTRSGAKRLMRAMLRSLMAMGRRARLPVAGFVLPTVTMVLLVVILLTVAITLRSFDRGNLARNVRVNQQVLAAATPALDRAKAKIQYMLQEDPQRPTATPSDAEMYRIMSSVSPSGEDLYKFGDEERLILKYPLNGAAPVNVDPQAPLGNTGSENEAINTAWIYPVDTNNNGRFDTFTLYGIFFRTPPRDVITGEFSRVREPLDARTPPMSLGSLDPACATEDAGNTVANLVGDSGWYKLDGRLKKSFFVYTVNVPITAADINSVPQALGPAEAFTGTPSISALEYQQDQIRIPLSNNAVVYEDDLDISPGPDLNLNGRIFTNSNLLVSGLNAARSIRLFEVSSKRSCFYDQENSRVAVGGNVINGTATNNTATNPVEVHLFKTKQGPDQPNTNSPAIDNDAQSVANTSFEALYNSDAYSQRLNAVVEGQKLKDATGEQDPLSVKQAVNPPAGSPNPPQKREDALQSYFKERLRKVPFLEAPLGSDAGVVPGVPPTSYIEGSGETLRPIDRWSFPTGDSGNNTGSASGFTGLTLRLDQLDTTNPDGSTVKPNEDEEELGDRVVVGNNLPAQRWSAPEQKFLGKVAQQVGTGVRERTPQVTRLADVGSTDRGNGLGETPDATSPFRDGFWERSAAQIPRNPLDGIGGLRVITSAGVYDRTNSFLPPPRWTDAAGTQKIGPGKADPLLFIADTTYDDPATLGVSEQYPVVWPDTMPMSPLGRGSQVYNNGLTGFGSGGWAPWDSAWSTDTDISANLTPAAEVSTTLLPGIIEDAATARKYAKGDLRMRASAVYHYANSGFNSDAAVIDQTPFACVSSYYDPSTASTARNIISLPDDVSGDPAFGARQALIGSNNGIAYTPIRTRPALASAPDARGWLISGDDPVLEAQANIVFPDGRFANGPLRTALQVSEENRTLAQKAAIDSTNCAIDILSGADANADIPPGAIKEVAFLNAREIKAVDRDDDTTTVNEAFTLSSRPPGDPQAAVLTGNYNQPLEERQPLEIRVTQLDIDLLRGQTFTGPNAAAEWLLPNSGIVYASRDDALPDRSNRNADPQQSKRLSGSDSRLDPTRKPNGIMLINGQFLFRGPGNTPAAVGSVADVVREKGLTLVSNLPVYIRGDFNPHGQNAPATPPAQPAFTTVEEFTDIVAANWGNFYTRNTLNPSFACRAGDPRLPSCTGDYWRPATVLADAVTLLSDRYRFGFRNEGDFDLRNNAGAAAVLRRRQRGFFNNNFVTNGLSSGAFADDGNLRGGGSTVLTDANYVAQANIVPTAGGPLPSSYFNNFVTPVQRRGPFPEYLMEVCTKLPVSECGDADWVVNPLPTAPGVTARDAGTTTYDPPNYSLANGGATNFKAGSTVDPPIAALQRFPRRVAFERTATAQLSDPIQPLGISLIGGTLTIDPTSNAPVPTIGRNSLWFATGVGTNLTYNGSTIPYQVNSDSIPPDTRDGSNTRLPTLSTTVALAPTAPTPPYAATVYDGTQPLLLPVLQLQNVSTATSGDRTGNLSALQTGWIPQAVETTFNLIIGANDTPSRILNGGNASDFNGGLQNLPRFLESWGRNGAITTNIRGSFIQLGRSAFSTAPYLPVPTQELATVFNQLNPPQTLTPTIPTTYNIETGSARIPYFSPPTRNWGYDVGLLSQPPDLFTQKLTTAPSRNQPAEFFREVARNDKWVKTLICGAKADGTPATSLRANEDCDTFPYQ
ncbi:hormogonium polysaccharide biosynthesis protein HpsA [Microcoleus sp. herbarium2]|uniref:hormogonium polysaccharide biosynthesis protein HpsA n=1 Tax=Microcoleus sp. herbarium2 TaxID=3055433 RepID=UPI002FD0E782